MKCLKNILNNFEFMTKTTPTNYFSLDGFSFGGLLEYILQHALAKFQPATTCNSQNTSQNTQKHQKHAILLSKPVALYSVFSFRFYIGPLRINVTGARLVLVGGNSPPPPTPFSYNRGRQESYRSERHFFDFAR